MKKLAPDIATRFFMLGIGGAGMSALARYFHHHQKSVAGYDRSHSAITSDLENLGMQIIYQDDPEAIPPQFLDPEKVLVVFTPAIKEQNRCYSFFRNAGFTMMKRAEVLGRISEKYRTVAIAGTHGKTTTSAMLSHILHHSRMGCNALLGGMMKNYQTNCLVSVKSDLLITEADEYDRSFLQLTPYMALITACDDDHLDIYGNSQELRKTFIEFAARVVPDGLLLVKKDIMPAWPGVRVKRVYTYSAEDSDADIFARNILVDSDSILFDFHFSGQVIHKLRLQPIGIFNVENAVAASFLALRLGVNEEDLRRGLSTFQGVRRRFDVLYHDGRIIYIDDYAHHPREIDALLHAVRAMFPMKKVTGIFQPHLYTRTRDLAEDFAKSLSQLDELILLDIYPAREEPIEGVSSKMLYDKISGIPKILLSKGEVPYYLLHHHFEVLLTIGAGDIDTLADHILLTIRHKNSESEIP